MHSVGFDVSDQYRGSLVLLYIDQYLACLVLLGIVLFSHILLGASGYYLRLGVVGKFDIDILVVMG